MKKIKKKPEKKYKRMPNEFHMREKLKGGRVFRDKTKYHRPSERKKDYSE